MKQILISFLFFLGIACVPGSTFGMNHKTGRYYKQGSKPKKQYALTEVHTAAYHGNATTLETLLIEENWDVDVRSKDNSTPLMLAALKGQKIAIMILLEAESLVNAQNNDGNTALHAAARMNQATIIPMLIAAGADPNIQNKYGDTPAHIAARNGNSHTLGALLAKGARIDIRNKKNELPEDITIDAMVRSCTPPPSLMPQWQGCEACLPTKRALEQRLNGSLRIVNIGK